MTQVYREPGGRRLRYQVAALFVLVAAVTLYSVGATQYAARQFGFAPALGTPLFGRAYQPFDWIVWSARFYRRDVPMFESLYLGFVIVAGVTLLTSVILIGVRTRTPQAWQDVQGSARFVDSIEELQEIGFLPRRGEKGSGIYLAAFPDHNGDLRYLRHPQIEHIHMIGPPGSGKGVAFIVNAILSWPSSMAVLDRKGELFEMTAGYLAAAGWRVVRWDPLADRHSIAINMLDGIRLGTPHEVGDAMGLAAAIIDPTKGTGASEYFNNAGYRLICGVILHVMYLRRKEGKLASLYDVALALSDPDRTSKGLYEEMKANRHVEIRDGGQVRRERHEFIATQGAEALQTAEAPKEFSATVNTARQNLFVVRDPLVRRNIERSDIAIDELMNGEQKIALFIVVPAAPVDEKRLRMLFRVFTTLLLNVPMRKQIKPEGGLNVIPHKRPLMLMLDEIGNMGPVDVLQPALAQLRGFGVKVICIWQTIAQINDNYGRDNAVLGTAEIKLSLAPSDEVTADWLSNSLGRATVTVQSQQISGARFGMALGQVSTSFHTMQRPLLTPDECSKLRSPAKDEYNRITEPGDIIVLKRGANPVRAQQLLFFQDPVLLGRVKMAPPDMPDSAMLRSREHAAVAFPGA